MAEGKFIVMEGIDGSGLTTQAELLKQALQKKGLETYLTKEPTDGPAGAIIRLALAGRLVYRPAESARESLPDLTLALLFAADRLDHLFNYVLPKLALGITVISDRYYLSSYAYQANGGDFEWLRQVNAKCRKPDLTIFLDVPVEICKKRMERERWHVEVFEEVPQLERVKQHYLAAIQRLQTEGERVEIVDGTETISSVHRRIMQIVQRSWKPKPPVAKMQIGFEGSGTEGFTT